MAENNDPIEIANELLKEGDKLVSRKKFEDAIIKYVFVSKYAQMYGDHKLATIGFIKQFELLIQYEDFQKLAIQSRLAFSSAQKSNDLDLQKKLLDLIKSKPELANIAAEYAKMFTSLLQNDSSQKKIITIKMRDNRGIQTEKKVELIAIRSIKDEYQYINSIKCDKCQSQKTWNPPSQVLLLGVNSGKLLAVDTLSSSCKNCQNPIELYFDVENFFWNKYPGDKVELLKERLITSMNLKEGEFKQIASNP